MAELYTGKLELKDGVYVPVVEKKDAKKEEKKE